MTVDNGIDACAYSIIVITPSFSSSKACNFRVRSFTNRPRSLLCYKADVRISQVVCFVRVLVQIVHLVLSWVALEWVLFR